MVAWSSIGNRFLLASLTLDALLRRDLLEDTGLVCACVPLPLLGPVHPLYFPVRKHLPIIQNARGKELSPDSLCVLIRSLRTCTHVLTGAVCVHAYAHQARPPNG